MFTEEDLNLLNYDVYNVDMDKHVKQDRPIPQKGEIYTLKNGKEVLIVDTKDDDSTGFQGMAVAPIVNNKPDYSQVAVVAAGTDPSQGNDLAGAAKGMSPNGSPQDDVALAFVKNLPDYYTVTRLTGYSQSAYMLRVGANLGIPTTVFNGWFQYRSLTKAEEDFMKKHPEMFINYRRRGDSVTFWNDFNNTSLFNSDDFGTIVWLDGSSHNIRDWDFDDEGNLIIKGDQKKARMSQIEKRSALQLWDLEQLKKKLKASGGGLSTNEQIYLDSSQALIAVETASQLMRTGLATVIKLYQNAITEAEDLWQNGLEIARAIGSDLNDSEIYDALEFGGASKASVLDEPTNLYEEKLSKVKEMSESFDSLVSDITESIHLLKASDQELAMQIGGS